MPRNIQVGWSADTVIGIAPPLTIADGILGVGAGIYLGIYIVTLYGAVGDGSHDDTSAIQDAIDAASDAGGTVYLPPGEYLITASLSVTANGVRLIGSGIASRILVAFDTDDAISTTTTTNFEIAYLAIEATVTRTGGAFVATEDNNNGLIHDITFTDAYDAISIKGGVNQFIANVWNIIYTRCANAAISLSEYPQDVYIRNVVGTNALNGLLITSGSGIYVRDCDFLASGGAGVFLNAVEGILQIRAVWMDTVLCDTGETWAWAFYGSNLIAGVYLTNCWGASSTADGGFRFANAAIDGVTMIGCVGHNNWETGISLESGCKNFQLQGCVTSWNSRAGSAAFSGIFVGSGVSNVTINGCFSGADGFYAGGTCAQQYGLLVDAGAGPDIVITSNNFKGNTTAGASVPAITRLRANSNMLFTTEASENTAIAVGDTFVDCPTGLDAPDANIVFNATPLADLSAHGAARYWASPASSGTVRISVDAAVTGSPLAFGWQANAFSG